MRIRTTEDVKRELKSFRKLDLDKFVLEKQVLNILLIRHIKYLIMVINYSARWIQKKFILLKMIAGKINSRKPKEVHSLLHKMKLADISQNILQDFGIKS